MYVCMYVCAAEELRRGGQEVRVSGIGCEPARPNLMPLS